MITSRFHTALTYTFMGSAYSLVMGFIAFGLGGAGHGWGAVSSTLVYGGVLCPALGLGAALRDTRFGRALLALVAIGAVTADVTLHEATERIEGWGYVFGKVANSQPGWLAA